MGKKRCIFHYPNPISDKMSAGSSVRPNQMLNAFKLCGYIVDDVTGYGSERKQKIREIKKNIKNGVKYDFVYSESINIPTVLSEENHIPIYPFLDFSFFTFCTLLFTVLSCMVLSSSGLLIRDVSVFFVMLFFMFRPPLRRRADAPSLFFSMSFFTVSSPRTFLTLSPRGSSDRSVR